MKFPEKYQKKVEAVKMVYDAVERTHPGCGKLALMEILCDAGNRTLLVVGSSGTGKSSILKFINSVIQRDKLFLDAVTVAGLRYIQKQLTNRTCSVLIDDLSKGGTEYSQVMTVCAMGELVYSGFVRKYTGTLQLEIENFHGSCIMNAQPLILKRILNAPEFETDIRDKVIRFYHIRRPIKVSLAPPSDTIRYGYNHSDISVGPDIMHSKLWREGVEQFRYEFSKARAEEHYTALIRASALINGRPNVEQADLWLVNELTKCFVLEAEIFSKYDLEGERRLDVNILPLFSVLSTYKKYKIKDLMTDFQVKERRIQEIIEENKEYVAKVKNKGEYYLVPTSLGIELLRKIGEWDGE